MLGGTYLAVCRDYVSAIWVSSDQWFGHQVSLKIAKIISARKNFHFQVPISSKGSKIHCFWLQILKACVQITPGSNFQLCSFFKSKNMIIWKWKKSAMQRAAAKEGGPAIFSDGRNFKTAWTFGLKFSVCSLFAYMNIFMEFQQNLRGSPGDFPEN